MPGRDNRTAIGRTELDDMRQMFDTKGISRNRACWRWSPVEDRWELYEVLPGNRTLIAHRETLGAVDFTEV